VELRGKLLRVLEKDFRSLDGVSGLGGAETVGFWVERVVALGVLQFPFQVQKATVFLTVL
jgi:hypothetical protein